MIMLLRIKLWILYSDLIMEEKLYVYLKEMIIEDE